MAQIYKIVTAKQGQLKINKNNWANNQRLAKIMG